MHLRLPMTRSQGFWLVSHSLHPAMKPCGRSPRLLSRPTRTVQDMTVESAHPPLLPLVHPLASDSRPAPDAAPHRERSQRSPRVACELSGKPPSRLTAPG